MKNATEQSKYQFQNICQDNYSEQTKYYNILYSFNWHINFQYAGPHIDKVQPCGTCIVFCILSCTHGAGVSCKEEEFLAVMSTVHPIHLFQSFFTLATCGRKRRVYNLHLWPNITMVSSLLVCLISTAFVKESLSIVDLSWWTIAGELCSLNVNYLLGHIATLQDESFLKIYLLIDERRFICKVTEDYV